MKIKTAGVLFSAVGLIFLILITANPKICADGAAEGLLISGRVIIPSLFPFTVCVLFCMRAGLFDIFGTADRAFARIFRTPRGMLPSVLFSFIGGYPIGAKLLNEAVKSKKISPENAGIMLCWCVNAGPAFVVSAVGTGVFRQQKAGVCLLAAHIASAVLIGFFGRLFMKPEKGGTAAKHKISAADNFVLSVSDAANAVSGICAYVIFFSAVTAFAENAGVPLWLSSLLEVTNGISKTRNLDFTAFLLGFSGLCIWCQVISVSRLIKINYPLFFAARITHGILSVFAECLIIKAFGISVPVLSSAVSKPFYGSAALSVSLLCTVIVLLITVYTKNSTGNIADDIV